MFAQTVRFTYGDTLRTIDWLWHDPVHENDTPTPYHAAPSPQLDRLDGPVNLDEQVHLHLHRAETACSQAQTAADRGEALRSTITIQTMVKARWDPQAALLAEQLFVFGSELADG